MMRIGLDARFMTHPQAGGFKTYTCNLVRALLEMHTHDEFILYVDREPGNLGLPNKGQVTVRVVGGTAPFVGMAWREQVALRAQFARDRLDLVHFLCNTATVGLRTRYVMTVHDTIQLEPGAQRDVIPVRARAQQAYSRWAIRHAVRAAAHVIAVSSHEANGLRATLGLRPGQVSVVPEAADAVFGPIPASSRAAGRAAIRGTFGIARPYLLSVGYEPRKNIPLVIEAFARVAADHPSLDLVLVASDGTGAWRRRFAAQLRAAGLEGRSHILAFPSAVDLARLYALCEAFVFPSEREGFGLPPLEALASGAPVVAANASSLPEVIGDAGLLVDGLEPGGWAKAIDRVLSDEALRSALSRRALARAACFSWRRTAEQTLAAYAQALAVPLRGVGRSSAVPAEPVSHG